jgi:DNA-directed RNA polymerase specialized sigma24 family protein
METTTQITKNAYLKVLENPTNDNKIYFVYHHKPYIESIMRKLMHKNFFDYEDLISSIMTHLYSKVHCFKFEYGYAKCKNLLSTIATNYCKNIYAYRSSRARIPDSVCDSLYQIKKGNDLNRLDIFDTIKPCMLMNNTLSEAVLHKVDLIKQHANKYELDIIEML